MLGRVKSVVASDADVVAIPRRKFHLTTSLQQLRLLLRYLTTHHQRTPSRQLGAGTAGPVGTKIKRRPVPVQLKFNQVPLKKNFKLNSVPRHIVHMLGMPKI